MEGVHWARAPEWTKLNMEVWLTIWMQPAESVYFNNIKKKTAYSLRQSFTVCGEVWIYPIDSNQIGILNDDERIRRVHKLHEQVYTYAVWAPK